MENQNIRMESSLQPSFLSNNWLTITLFILLLASLLGVNMIESVFVPIKNFIIKILQMAGFYSGAVINSSADIIGDTAKGGIDIAEGTIHSIGNLLQNEDNMDGPPPEQVEWNMNLFQYNPTPTPSHITMVQNIENKIDTKKAELKELDNTINSRKVQPAQTYSPSAATTENTTKWCPIGSIDGETKCVSISSNDKCMYGKVYDTQDKCEQSVSTTDSSSMNWGIPPPPPPMASLAPPPPSNTKCCQELPGMVVSQPPIYGVINTANQAPPPVVNRTPPPQVNQAPPPMMHQMPPPQANQAPPDTMNQMPPPMMNQTEKETDL